jgi:uncharacterized protein with GYD domain
VGLKPSIYYRSFFRAEGIKAGEAMGGKSLGCYLTMGEYDYVWVSEAPNDEVALTFLLGLGIQGNVLSLLFARILGDTAATEAALSPELTKAKQPIKELQTALDEAEMRISDAEARAIAAEQRFAAAGDLFARLFAEEKRERILAASERWPELPAASIAIIAGASPGYEF